MLEIILDRHIIFVLMGILTVAGIAGKCIVNVTLKKLVRAAGNMGKSNHPLMRLVRAKFEHASMVSDKVENVRVFVDKYLFEYKVLGMKLHGWRRMEKVTAGLCLLAGVAGALLEYSVHGMSDMVLKTGAAGAALAVLIYLVHLTTDENYRMEAIQNYMVDYLENICRHKYEKNAQKEIKVLAQDGGAAQAADYGVTPEERGRGKRGLWGAKDSGMAGSARRTSEYALAAGYDGSVSGTENAADYEMETGESGTVSRQAGAVQQVSYQQAEQVQSQEAGQSLQSRQMKQAQGAQYQQAGQMQGAQYQQAGQMQGAQYQQAGQMQGAQYQPAGQAQGAQYQPAGQTEQTSKIQQVHSQTKDKKTRREQVEEEIDKDVAIRRILEEFMA